MREESAAVTQDRGREASRERTVRGSSRRFTVRLTRLRDGWSLILRLCTAITVAHVAYGGPIEEPPGGLVARGANPSSALLRGKVMRRALQADSSQQYFVYVPARGGLGAPIFVTVHGISRNVEEHATLFAPYAEKYGVVMVAPFFTKDRNTGYQWLGREPSGRRADITLDAILEEVTATTGADAGKLFLFGFSGGAQFAHRYTLAHPDRVTGTAVGAAGWYTFPDLEKPYPYGLGPSKERPSLRFEPEKFLKVPITVFVGENDTGVEHLRRNRIVDRQQGATRLDRAQNWVAAMRRAAERRGLAPLVTCERVPGIEHSFKQFMEEGRLGSRVFEVLFGSSRTRGDAR